MQSLLCVQYLKGKLFTDVLCIVIDIIIANRSRYVLSLQTKGYGGSQLPSSSWITPLIKVTTHQTCCDCLSIVLYSLTFRVRSHEETTSQESLYLEDKRIKTPKRGYRMWLGSKNEAKRNRKPNSQITKGRLCWKTGIKLCVQGRHH